MATYKEIGTYVKKEYGFTPKSCWIAHMKEVCGIKVRVSYNRHDITKRKYPCPLKKMYAIENAFIYFKMI